ncbi:MAG TPA: preprotein translocase subunit SecE [Spirochaetota bacterium]|nr:preprotein translocase subunit SecE [Spirochaetota bacterium]
MFKKTVTFVKEARDELGKVTWPERDEVTSFTIVVVVTVVIVSLFLWAVDTTLMSLIQSVM